MPEHRVDEGISSSRCRQQKQNSTNGILTNAEDSELQRKQRSKRHSTEWEKIYPAEGEDSEYTSNSKNVIIKSKRSSLEVGKGPEEIVLRRRNTNGQEICGKC